nr:retrovirus-related Pol polyprotein from transposon TNT 1-94 [Tanacetum cinerariifolium]
FETRFVSQTESSAKQAFWSQYLVQTDEPNPSGTTIVEVLKELPKASMVNSCLKKLKFHLASFDMVVKERTTTTAITEGTCGFKHTKACFCDDIIPFVKSLKELFTSFDQCLIDEVTEVQNVFTQMEMAVEQHCEEKTKVQIKMENVLQENDRLLTQALSVEIVNIVVNENMKFVCLNVTACARCVTTESELKTDFLKNECYDTLLQKYHTLEKHCITMEVNNQLNQRDTWSSQESAPTFAELFQIDNLKAQAQAKDTEKVLVITALKVQLNKLKGKAVITEAVSLNPIDPELLKVDVAPLVPKLRKNRTAHTDYIGHTQEEAATLKEIVESCLNRPLMFLGTVKFGNDYVVKIMDYGDYQIGNVTISWVYYVEGLGHNFFSVGQFCDSVLEVAFRQHTCFIRNLDGVDLLTGSRGNNLYTLSIQDMMRPPQYVTLKVSVRRIRTDNGTEFVNQKLRDYYEEVDISHETSVTRSPQQNGVVKRRNHTLIEAARTMLIYAQAPLFLWAEAVATACFTQNRSIVRLRHGKTPYELLHNKLHDLSFFYVFGALCYPTNDSENLGKLQPKADIGIFIGYALTKKAFRIYNRHTRRIVEIIHVDFDELTAMAFKHRSLGPALNEMNPRTISSGLVPTTSHSTSYVPPSRNDWDLLFQLMFDELLNPRPSVVNSAPKAIAPIAEVIPPGNADSTGLPSSTMVEQDAPSTSNSSTPTETQSSVIPQDVRDDNLDMEVAYIRNDPLFGVPFQKKSKYVKTPGKRKVWKPTGNVFKTVGHIWKPTGWTFKIVGNEFPLTRIATPTIVPPREPIPIVNSMDKPVVTLVYTRKPKAAHKKVKEKQENDKIGSKPDKNGKRVEAGKSSKQLQWVEEEKLNKTQKKWP